ncbi:hypothetical protein VCSRO172_3432 [Vibrio cholerae]|nr:hypothetical protein VCSRO172_3432 [Vibrio cholerae]
MLDFRKLQFNRVLIKSITIYATLILTIISISKVIYDYYSDYIKMNLSIIELNKEISLLKSENLQIKNTHSTGCEKEFFDKYNISNEEMDYVMKYRDDIGSFIWDLATHNPDYDSPISAYPYEKHISEIMNVAYILNKNIQLYKYVLITDEENNICFNSKQSRSWKEPIVPEQYYSERKGWISKKYIFENKDELLKPNSAISGIEYSLPKGYHPLDYIELSVVNAVSVTKLNRSPYWWAERDEDDTGSMLCRTKTYIRTQDVKSKIKEVLNSGYMQ